VISLSYLTNILGELIDFPIYLIGIVLAQHGKGADAGVVMGGSGNNNTVFGAGGAADFTTKLTTGLAIAFMISSIFLVRSYQQGGVGRVGQPTSVLEGSLMQSAPEALDLSVIGQEAMQFEVVEESFDPDQAQPAPVVEEPLGEAAELE